MSGISIITASAGTGKTTRLAAALEEALVARTARAEAVVATTFTRKAAAELMERARTRLLEHGRTDDAERLAAARIGTVNAVCGKLVRDFAFELGLSPDVQVIDEQVAAHTLHQAITQVLAAAESDELAALEFRLCEFEWKVAVRQLVESARANGIGAQALATCKERSKQDLLSLFGKPVAGDGHGLDKTLADALEEFVRSVDRGHDSTKVTGDAVDRAERALGNLRAERPLKWVDWASLAGLKVGKKSADRVAPIHDAAAAHDRHPRLHRDIERAVELVFDVAARALAAYDQRKRAWGVIDFVDQEVYTLQLLKTERVVAQLRGEMDLVLVDEFQDTSPIQLAIFLALAQIAGRSVWVGDQKQAIFGFRGTDPELMGAAVQLLEGSDPTLVDATLATLFEAGEPERLLKSYRSRPELVRLTSELFAKAFSRHGFREEHVRIEPDLDPEPPGLGPIAEYWRLAIPHKQRTTDYAQALAAAVAQLLRDPDATVRDGRSGEVRALRAEDVVILARRNEVSGRIAAALAELDVRSVLPRPGLLTTPEGCVVMAALRLWMDSHDTLAMAELARFIDFGDAPDAWIERLVAAKDEESFANVASVERLRQAKSSWPAAGLVAAFDLCVEATGIRDLCRRWGDAGQRLANVDALRARAATYSRRCVEQGVGSTMAGLLAELQEQAATGEDGQAVLAQAGAVTVSTWHAAKGLEWPVTVLFDLDWRRQPSALGVHVISDRDRVDLTDPLGGRWIRYWPTPYTWNQHTPFATRLAGHPASALATEEHEREELRLLYVGWTRARDRLVLACGAGKLGVGALAELRDDEGALVTEPAADDPAIEQQHWAGYPVDVLVRLASPAAPSPRSVAPDVGYKTTGQVAYPPAFMAPSDIEAVRRAVPSDRGPVAEPEQIGDRLPITGQPDMDAMGSAVHGFFAADRAELAIEARREVAADLLEHWGVASALSSDSLVQASNALRAWAERRWPGAVWHRELPIHHRLHGGTVLRGVADLVLETASGLVVIDHKSFPGAIQVARDRVAQYAPQLSAYADGLRVATGKPVLARFIHTPVSGLVWAL